MAHYAKIKDGIVIDVIVADQEYIDNLVDFVPGFWLQTSYNTRGGVHYEPNSNTPSEDQSKALRKNFASVGYSYNAGKDAFIPPKVYPSWTLDDTTCMWKPPIAKPIDGNDYKWNEINQSWDLMELGDYSVE